MSGTTTTEPASEKHISFLELVISERFDEVPSRDRLPSTKLAVGAMIDKLRKERPPLAATEAQVEELKSLADQLGISIVAKEDRAGINRQLFDLRKRLNSAAWTQATAEADEAITALFG